MLITVLTVVYNGERYIERTIQSVLAQNYKKIEYIVVDGGSTDKTLNIIRKYAAHLDAWISEPDQGIADALNKGLKMATGRYLLVLHANDELLQSSTIQFVQKVLCKKEVDILSFPVWKEKKDGTFFLYRPIKMIWWHHFKTIIPHQGAFVNRTVFDKIGEFRTEFSIALDYDFFYRALHCGFTVKFENQPVAVMRGQGISSDPGMVKKRLFEEALVQRMNERKLFWRLAQKLFQALYFPYKTQFSPSVFSR